MTFNLREWWKNQRQYWKKRQQLPIVAYELFRIADNLRLGQYRTMGVEAVKNGKINLGSLTIDGKFWKDLRFTSHVITSEAWFRCFQTTNKFVSVRDFDAETGHRLFTMAEKLSVDDIKTFTMNELIGWRQNLLELP